MASTYEGTLVSSAAVGGDVGATTYHLATTSPNTTTEAMQAMTNALRFATSKSIRTSTIILASFNALAASATALGIIYSCYTYSKRAQKRQSNAPVMQYETKPLPNPTPVRPSGLFFIHTVEVFPLVLSLGIAIQSIIFAAAQSIGLQALLSRGCTAAAVFLLPALFIAPYIQLVFGVETAVREYRSQFSARRVWNVTICLGIVAALLLVNLFVAVGDQAPDYCFASLFWILEHFAVGVFVLLLLISIALILVIATILVRLSKSHMVEPTERVAASRMIYYLILGFISNAFIIPYFFSLTFLDQTKHIFETLNLSMVASVVSNVNGLMVACLHMFLRSQTNTAIGQNYHTRDKYKHDTQESSDDYRMSTHAMQSVTNTNNDDTATSGSFATLQHAFDAEEGKMGESPTSPSPLSPDNRPSTIVPGAPTLPAPTQPPPSTHPMASSRQSYSLFPNTLPAAAATLPAAAYAPETTRPGREHRRGSSIDTSATVQIGIRLSNVDDYRSPKTSMDTQRPPAVARPSPLAQVESRPASGDAAPERLSTRDALMKKLPPVPTASGEDDEPTAGDTGGSDGTRESGYRMQSQQITLNPSVYRPEDNSPVRETASNGRVNRDARVPSLSGVRRSVAASRGDGDRGSVQAPPRPRGSVVRTQASVPKADWI